MIDNVTLETLPQAFMQLYKEIVEIKQLMQDQRQIKQAQSEKLMTVEDVAKYLSLSKFTIYGLVNKDLIPYMKRGKRLYFTAEQLTLWLKSGRKQNNVDHLPNFRINQNKAA